MRGKKGAAHFEMIVSFIFFVGFVFFLFVVLQPYDKSVMTGAVVEGLYDSFEEQVQTNLTNVFVESGSGGDCFKIGLPGGIFRYGLTESSVRKVDDSLVDSGLSGNYLDIDSDEYFHKVAISPEFDDGDLADCSEVSLEDLGSILEREVISYRELVEMDARYDSDYEGLRDDLNVPAIFDFAIFSEELPDVRMERQVPDEGEVIARDYILEVLNSSGDVVNARFTLKIW